MKTIVRLAAVLLVAGCASGPGPRAPIEGTPSAADIRALAVEMGFMKGTFDSVDQEGGGPGAGTRMRIAPLWTERQDKGEFWFYVEHSRMAEDPKPFRQRIYRFLAVNNNFFADVYALPGDPAAYVNEWRKPEPFKGVNPDSLHEFPNCRMKMGQMLMMFWVRTEGTACKAENPDVAYETSEMFGSSMGMKEGTFGYDKSGNKISGESGVWDFRRFNNELLP
jgi:hypothetical protein